MGCRKESVFFTAVGSTMVIIICLVATNSGTKLFQLQSNECKGEKIGWLFI